MYSDHITCIYYDHRVCMYYEHTISMYYAHYTRMVYDQNYNVVILYACTKIVIHVCGSIIIHARSMSLKHASCASGWMSGHIATVDHLPMFIFQGGRRTEAGWVELAHANNSLCVTYTFQTMILLWAYVFGYVVFRCARRIDGGPSRSWKCFFGLAVRRHLHGLCYFILNLSVLR